MCSLAAAVVASGAILIALGSHLVFRLDEWDLLLNRRGLSAGVFLDPHNDHITIVPVAIYKVLLEVFGMSSAVPFNVVSTLVFLASAVLLFALVRRRIGDWAALIATVAILFLGSAWEDLLSAFQVGYFGSIAAGLGAMLALDRRDRLGDRLACVLIVVATSFSELGIPFAIAALLDVALDRRSSLDRLYVPLVPIALYGLWWLGWGHTAHTSLTLHNVAIAPQYALDQASSGLAGLLGLAGAAPGAPTGPSPLDWGRALLLVAGGLGALRLYRLGRVPRGVWVALGLGASFWLLTGLNQNVFRPPTSGRYLYPSAVFIVVIASELLSGLGIRRVALVVAAIVAAAAVASNLSALESGYRSQHDVSDLVRTDLAALEVARPAVVPGFVLDTRISGLWLQPVNASAYFSAVDAFGSPAGTPAELAAAPESSRLEADRIVAASEGLRLAPALAAGRAGRGAGRACRVVRATAAQTALLHLGPGAVTVRNDGTTPADVLLGRFADALPVDLGGVAPRRSASLTIPADRSTIPWRLGLGGRGAVTVCARGGGSL